MGSLRRGRLVAACHVAANLVPVQAGPEDAVVFADRALARRRTVSTIVGPQDAVLPFWSRVGDAWGPPRESAGTNGTWSSTRTRRSRRTRQSG